RLRRRVSSQSDRARKRVRPQVVSGTLGSMTERPGHPVPAMTREGGTVAGDNLVLVVGSYADAGAAADDLSTLESGQDAGEYQIDGAVVMNRDASGKVEVKEHDDRHVGHGAAWGAGAGIVVGLFAPPLLAATAIGAGIGAGIGALKKRHEEKQLGVDVDEYLPPGSSAVVAGLADRGADKGEEAPGQTGHRKNNATRPRAQQAPQDA